MARAVGSSIPDIAALRTLMARPDVFALIKAPVPGFERRFTKMLEDGLLALNQPSFADIIEWCRAIQGEANRQAL